MAKREILITGQRVVPPVLGGPEFDPKVPAGPAPILGASADIQQASSISINALLAQAGAAGDITQSAVALAVASLASQISIAQPSNVSIVAGLSGYTPQSEASPLLWFDMLDPTAYTLNGGSTGITQLKNKISNVQWAKTTNDCPFEAAGLNGHPCLHPLVVGDALQSVEAAVVAAFDCPDSGAAKPYTIYYAVKPDSSTTGNVTFGVGNSAQSSASTRVWGQRATISQYEYAQTVPAPAGTARSTQPVSTNFQICCWHSPGVGARLSLNDTADDPANVALDPRYTPGVGPNRASLFSRPDSSPDGSAVQRFGELWIFAAEHDAAARTRVHNWLAAKWA